MFKESYFRKVAVSGKFQKQIRFLATAAKNGDQHFKLVIVGGGAGGATMAARLNSKLGGQNIAVIEPSEVHYYQPYFTLIGAGIKQFEDSYRLTSTILPKDVKWIKDSVIAFNPSENNVETKENAKITYDCMIVAMGLTLAFDKIKGLPEAFETPGVCSNYSPATVNKTVLAISQCKSGNAIFTQPVNPIKCAGAPQKIMYLADDIFKKTGRAEGVNVLFFTALDFMFSAPKYDRVLRSVAEDKGINVNYEHNLIEVNPDKKEAVFQILNGSTKSIQYDMLHVTPPMSPPLAIKNSDLAHSTGFLDVDKNTLQHNVYKNVFGIGDCTSVPTSKTAAAVASQCGVLTTNLMAAIEGKPLLPSYTGYTSCPLVTGNNKGILAEFDFDLKPMETLPINQGKERYISFLLKRDVLPFIYWNMMLKGHWKGPALLRKILHLGR